MGSQTTVELSITMKKMILIPHDRYMFYQNAMKDVQKDPKTDHLNVPHPTVTKQLVLTTIAHAERVIKVKKKTYYCLHVIQKHFQMDRYFR